MNRTHIETLADNCPKSRRRVRRTLGFAPYKSGDRAVTHGISDDGETVAETAQRIAAAREQAATRKAAKGGAA